MISAFTYLCICLFLEYQEEDVLCADPHKTGGYAGDDTVKFPAVFCILIDMVFKNLGSHPALNEIRLFFLNDFVGVHESSFIKVKGLD